MTRQQRKQQHIRRMKRICRRVIAVSERQYLLTGKQRHDYQVAKTKLAELGNCPLCFRAG